MSFFDKLKDIPGVGTPSPGAGEPREPGPIKQAFGVIGQDIQVRTGNAIIDGWNSVVNPPKGEPKKELTEEEKLDKKNRRSNAMRKAGEVGVAGLHLGAGLIKRVVDVARKSNSSINIKTLPSGKDDREIIDAEFTVLDEKKGDSQNG